jgi:hypothetical protein
MIQDSAYPNTHAEYLKTEVGAQAVAKCQRGERWVELTTPCGGLGQLCCVLAPSCWQTTAQVPAPKCMSYDALGSVSRCEVDKVPPILQTDYPEGEEFGENPQGVAHDSNHWYFTARNFVAKVPVSTDLGTIGTIQSFAVANPFAGKYAHYGDLAHADGRLYIPLEQGAGGLKNAIGIVDAATLTPITFVELPELAQAPWCEVFEGVLYTSGDHLGPAQAVIRRYKLTSSGLGLEPMPSLLLRNHEYETAFFLDHVQGGAISPASHTLYISTTAAGSSGLSALWGFDLVTGAWRGVKEIATYGTYPVIIPEVEGLDYWDDPPSPNIGGQLHVVIGQIQDVTPSHSDDYTFAHFRVAVSADLSRF